LVALDGKHRSSRCAELHNYELQRTGSVKRRFLQTLPQLPGFDQFLTAT
jgi:hypothetical protein